MLRPPPENTLRDFSRRCGIEDKSLDDEIYFSFKYFGQHRYLMEPWVRDGFDRTAEELSSFACSLHTGAAK